MGNRRSDGEGTDITKGSDGRWHAYLSVGTKPDGSRDRRHLSGRTRADVAAQLRQLQKQKETGLVPAPRQTLTVAEWLTHWLEHIAPARVRPSTLHAYETYINGRIIPALGQHRLDRLLPEHVEKFYRDCTRPGIRIDPQTGRRIEQKPMQPASILHCHRILSRALKVAMQRERVGRNVCTLVDAPRVVRAEVEPLTNDEARKVLHAAKADRNAARWSVALALGLRQGEALGLQWKDVDLDAGTVRIRRALQRQGGTGLVFVEPKSRAGRRTIALPGQLVEVLRGHRDQQNIERLAAANLWHEYDLVFAQVTGKPIDPRRDYLDWKALLRRAEVRDARLHDARHTAATLLLTQGVPARVAMQILGHSQITLTLGTYSHVAPELGIEAARRIGNALWGDGPERPGTGSASIDI
ncbi:MAG TPA: site-specific integrase [Jatrophihabitans sp.]|nr:site-specific integrase [Jatrophihabitans sp.]